jgi:hypothetical protein
VPRPLVVGAVSAIRSRSDEVEDDGVGNGRVPDSQLGCPRHRLGKDSLPEVVYSRLPAAEMLRRLLPQTDPVRTARPLLWL